MIKAVYNWLISDWKGIVYLILLILSFVWYLFFLLAELTSKNRTSESESEFFKHFKHPWFLLFPIPFLLIRLIHIPLKYKWKNNPVYDKSGVKMEKLKGSKRKYYLTDGQICEEKIGAINYSVYESKTGGRVKIKPYHNFIDSIVKCPKCEFTTSVYQSEEMIKYPREDRHGICEKKYTCQFCDWDYYTKYDTPKLPKVD